MKRKKIVASGLLYLFLAATSLLMIIPFIWMVCASLKLNKDVFSTSMSWLPEKFIWSNYVVIWSKIPLLVYFFNTAKITILTTIIQVITSCLAAYGFSKLKFKGRDFWFLAYVVTIAIPWQVYMVPQFIMMSKIGLVDSHVGLILLQAFSAFGVFLVRQFYMSIPNELCEAARIDGLSEYGIFARIVFPLGKPAVATLVIFTFVNVWNDFMGPLIYIRSAELKTVQLGIRGFLTQYGADYAWIMAASVCAMVPVTIVFLSCQKYFIEGAASSGIKG